MPWFQPSKWLSCIFCNSSRATHHRLCQDCWQNLPWDLQAHSRQDVDFIAACDYTHPMDSVLHQFKDKAELHYLPLLQACLMQIPKPQVQALVPMPISTEKLIMRGYSQTYLLTQSLAKQWNLPVWQPVKRHFGESQRGLDRAQRLQNLEQQFYIDEQQNHQYRKVLMVDDVITTGASLFALQQQLSTLGCNKIQAICVCKA